MLAQRASRPSQGHRPPEEVSASMRAEARSLATPPAAPPLTGSQGDTGAPDPAPGPRGELCLGRGPRRREGRVAGSDASAQVADQDEARRGDGEAAAGPGSLPGDEGVPRARPRTRNPPGDSQSLGLDNPLGVVFEHIAHLQGRGDRVTRRALLDILPDDWSMSVLRHVVYNWQSLGALYVEQDSQGTLTLRESFITASPPHSDPWEALPAGPGAEHPALALLSLFAGVGTEMLAIGTMLQAHGAVGRFHSAWHVEAEDRISAAVTGAWASAQGAGSYVSLGNDVWQLLAQPYRLRAALARLPRGALLLIVAGSPCQDLTVGGRHRGQLGLVGPSFLCSPACRPGLSAPAA